MNGQESAAIHVAAFEQWIERMSDGDYSQIVRSGHLGRSEICRECNFARSVLHQNPRVKQLLAELEGRLRERGVLPRVVKADHAPAPPLRPTGQLQAIADAERLKRLEVENAALRVDLAGLRERMRHHEARVQILGETGRLPR
jgi:hypothetical protein